MSTTLKQKLVCATAAIAASVAFTAASAGPAYAQDMRVRAVSYADLDLSRDAGKATLASRIAAAAKQVCSDSSDRRERANQRRCIEQAKTEAAAQMPTRS
jgi:UrcA family protein